jgi:DNA-binding NtrC family response regulator
MMDCSVLADDDTFRLLVASKKVVKGKGCGDRRGIAEKFRHPSIVGLKLSQVTGSNIRQKAVPLNPDIMVLLLTGTYDSNVSTESFFPSASDYYVKPCGQEEKLHGRVMNCLYSSSKNGGAKNHKKRAGDIGSWSQRISRHYVGFTKDIEKNARQAGGGNEVQ